MRRAHLLYTDGSKTKTNRIQIIQRDSVNTQHMDSVNTQHIASSPIVFTFRPMTFIKILIIENLLHFFKTKFHQYVV